MEKKEETKSEDKKEKEVWEEYRKKLKDYSYNDDWKVVIDLFDNRIRKKFIEPLNLLKTQGNNEGSGFSIVAIECLLIELFASFREGKVFNVRYIEKDCPPYQYKDCQSLYVNFLTTVSPFNSQFSSDLAQIKNQENYFSAIEFYTHVRCGLLHEGRTKGQWTINTKPSTEPIGIFLKEEGENLKIFRTVFLTKLEYYLAEYVKELKGEKGVESQNRILRKNFARKMDHLYEMKSKNVDWWKWEKPAKSNLKKLKSILRKFLQLLDKSLDRLF